MTRYKNSQRRTMRKASYRSDPTITLVAGFSSEVNLTDPGSQVNRWDYDTAVNTDEFTSMSQQYSEFRIKSMRFRITDIQPYTNGSVVNYWSTYHAIGETPLTIGNIVDRVDVKSLSPTTGSYSFHWKARGVNELRFQPTGGLAGNYINYGGLGGITANSLAIPNGAKYSVIAQFEMEFRGRK